MKAIKILFLKTFILSYCQYTQFLLVDFEYSTKSNVSCQTITIRTEVPTQTSLTKCPPCEMKFRPNRNFRKTNKAK
jgi:hypothetical protein